jgi:Mycothiol maleylpyruvate isomerase N-terminal domain
MVEGVKGLEWVDAGGARTSLDVEPAEVTAAALRVWRRLLDAINALPADSGDKPTRCSEWAVVDLVNHLADVTGMARQVSFAALEGKHTGIFDGFDPARAPKQLTDAAVRDLDTARGRARDVLSAAIAEVGASAAVAGALQIETPLGVQPFPAALLHGFWDAWLHERDLLIPLGATPPELDDELRLHALYSLHMAGCLQRLFRRTEASITLAPHGAGAAVRVDLQGTEVRTRLVPSLDDDAEALRGDAAIAEDVISGRGDQDALQGPDTMRKQVRIVRTVMAGI